MNKLRILPRLALTGMRKNASAYLPYILASSFAVFVFFIFCAIVKNEFMQELKYSGYVISLMNLGIVLLGIILVPFLFYTNNFLMKRRKRELGLYSILGLEKKHIGLIVLIETAVVFAITILLGILCGLVFSKFIFMLLLNITELSVNVSFTANLSSYVMTLVFFGAVSILNLLVNLFQVSLANPAELFRSSQKGEKQPKNLWVGAILGILCLGAGYYIAVIAQLNSAIFGNFFFAVMLVILGTHFLFTSGIIAFLRMLKHNKKLYYKKQNFVTVSGMLYRMRKSAAGLVNICIFSTMVIITLVCTVSLYTGLDKIVAFQHPYGADYRFISDEFVDKDAFLNQIATEAGAQKVQVSDLVDYHFQNVKVSVKQNDFTAFTDKGPDQSTIKLITLEDYNRIEKTNETLGDGEVLIFSSGRDFGFDTVNLGGQEYSVKKELTSFSIDSKEVRNGMGTNYIIVDSTETLHALAGVFGSDRGNYANAVCFNFDGEKSSNKAFIDNLTGWCKDKAGYYYTSNRITGREESAALNGCFLFLGVFFSIIFTVCMVMIMYYKQLSEGYEDKENFKVMQQVGMSDTEVKSTIRRQILTVFFLPLVVAIVHTSFGLKIVIELLGALNLFDARLIILCTAAAAVVFAVVYAMSYLMTAKAYYKIVRQ